MSKKLGYYDCPVCKQDMRAQPHPGWRGKKCKRCGQGIEWRFAAKIKRMKERKK